MKKLSFLFMLVASIAFFSCGGGSKSHDDHNHDGEGHEEHSDAKDADKINDCDEFLDKYEALLDEYLVVMGKLSSGEEMEEADTKQMEEMQEQLAEYGMNWIKLTKCMMKPKYQERYLKISEKYAAAGEEMLENLGLEDNTDAVEEDIEETTEDVEETEQ